MFTDKAQLLVDLAKQHAAGTEKSELGIISFVAAVGHQNEAAILTSELINLEPDRIRDKAPKIPDATFRNKMPLAETVRTAIGIAKELAEEIPDRSHPGLIDLKHMIASLAMSPDFCVILGSMPCAREDAERTLALWCDREATLPSIDQLMERLRRMRSDLLAKVFGQDHAIHAFVEGVFNAEIVAEADTKRRAPRAVFVFAGPPGVGKTFLAESAAAWLDRPFKRFDMTTYADHQASSSLIGWSKSYHAAHPGILTEFVEKNPNAILLFDEIEKAHLNTIQLFLQILDAGVLEDKYYERDVAFRDTTIIFTTNAGRKLYDRPNESGVHTANASFHRKTILDALENEKDPRTGQPCFPPAICSRLATGYPVLFNHLHVNELQRVALAELHRVGGLLERQFYKRIAFHELMPMALVLREGARTDARTLRSQVEVFVKSELFKFCQLFETDRLENVFSHIDHMDFTVDQKAEDLEPNVLSLFESTDTPHVLLVTDESTGALYRESLADIVWSLSTNAEDALQVLAEEDVDLALVDLWLGRSAGSLTDSVREFDHLPMAYRGLDQGQELLRKIRERLPGLPVFLLSFTESDGAATAEGSVDDELLMACVRGGGARGMIVSRFVDTLVRDWREQRNNFREELLEVCRNLHREKAAEKMGQERKVLTFDTEPRISQDKKVISIRLRSLRLTRALASADAGEVLEDVERPRTKFDDVIGADGAKDELKFFIDFLKNPRRFAALGLVPPKGILLHGPPGTGKTMLARAMAGESDVAFIPASGSSFVTVWQGSGPQNVRDLFARARRYAPAIVFIDEIDAIGKVRTGGTGAGQATENTLNALLTEMDGFTSPSPDRPVFILAATNFKVEAEDQSSPERSARTLDPALVRRFSRTILVDLPERAAREQYLNMRLKTRPACAVPDDIIKLIAERSTGMTIANLEQVIEAAARNAVKAGQELSGKLLEEALETVRYGEARISRDREDVKRTAYHEAGHTIMYWLSGWWPTYVTVVARGEHGGYMAPCAAEAEKKEGKTKEELLDNIRCSLGGRGAELLVYGPENGLSTGPSSDLEHATNIARAMVCRYGMDPEFGLLVTPELMKYEGALSSPMYVKVNEAASRILKEQMDLTEKLLKDNRQHLEVVAQALAEKERLTTEELRGILPTQTPHRPD